MKDSKGLAIILTPAIHLSWERETWKNAAFSRPWGWAVLFHGVTEVLVSPWLFPGMLLSYSDRKNDSLNKNLETDGFHLKFNLLWEFLHPLRHPLLPPYFWDFIFSKHFDQIDWLTSAFGQHGVTGTDLFSWLKQLKKKKKAIYKKTMIFRNWTSGSTRHWSLREG